MTFLAEMSMGNWSVEGWFTVFLLFLNFLALTYLAWSAGRIAASLKCCEKTKQGCCDDKGQHTHG